MSPNLTPMCNEINPKTLVWDCCHIHEWTAESFQNEAFVWLYFDCTALYLKMADLEGQNVDNQWLRFNPLKLKIKKRLNVSGRIVWS